MLRAWLLLLGSNLDNDERVRAVLPALRAIGAATWASPILKLPAYGDPEGHAYWNALATLESDQERPMLVASLKRVEHGLGRVHGSGRVAIDIDVLACREGTRWLADPHALAKGDLEQPPAQQLLREAGIAIDSRTPPNPQVGGC